MVLCVKIYYNIINLSIIRQHLFRMRTRISRVFYNYYNSRIVVRVMVLVTYLVTSHAKI